MTYDPGNSNEGTAWYRGLRCVLGVALICLGIFYPLIVHAENPPFRVFCGVVGFLLVYSAFAFLVPQRLRLSRFRWFRWLYGGRLSIPTEVMAYLTIMAVLVTGSMLGHSNTLLMVFSLMCGPFVLNGWIVFVMLRRLGVERSLPTSVGAGETFTVQLTLANNRRRFSSRLMRLEDQISNDHEHLTGRVLFFRVPVQESRTAGYRVRLLQRGQYKFGPVLVSSRFPFGLGERGRFFETHSEVLVHPQIGEIAPAWWQNVMGQDRVIDQSRAQRGLLDDEFRQIREYRPGDAIRRIHWRTSARTDELMVQEFEENRDEDAALLVDLWDDGTADSEQLERVISFVATTCVELSRNTNEAQVDFHLSADETVSVSGKASGELWREALDALAKCQPAESNLVWLAERSRSIQEQNLRPIVITTRPTDSIVSADFGDAILVAVNQALLADVFRLEAGSAFETKNQMQLTNGTA